MLSAVYSFCNPFLSAQNKFLLLVKPLLKFDIVFNSLTEILGA